MAAKKAKSNKKVTSKAKAVAKTVKKAVAKTAKKVGKKVGKKAAKKVGKKAAKQPQGLLGKIVQRSAQLVLDSGLLGEVPKRPSKRAAKKRARKS